MDKSFLDDFTLVRRVDGSDLYVSFYGEFMRFSNECIRLLDEADYVQIRINTTKKLMLVKAAPEDADPSTLYNFLHSWKVRAAEGRKVTKEAKSTSVSQLRHAFEIKGTHRFPGKYIPEENALLFDIGRPYKSPRQKL